MMQSPWKARRHSSARTALAMPEAFVSILNVGTDTPVTHYAEDLGGGEVTDANTDLWLSVHGAVNRPDSNPPPTRAWPRSVRVPLQAGDDPSTGHQRKIQTLDVPQVLDVERWNVD